MPNKPTRKLCWNEKRRCWTKWHPVLKKMVHVAGDVDESVALREWDSILRGNARRATRNTSPTLAAIAARWLEERRLDVTAGKIGADHYGVSRRALADMVAFFGDELLVVDMVPDDWTRYARHLERLAPSSRRRARAIILSMFRQADDDGWIESMPRFGRAFRDLAKIKAAGQVRPFTQPQCLAILSRVDGLARHGKRMTNIRSFLNLRAAFYLGLNGGLTPSDLGHLMSHEIDLDNGWIRHVRHKIDKAKSSPREAVQRRIPLWPETIRALRAAMQPDGLALVTRFGRPLRYAQINAAGAGVTVDSVSNLFRDVAREVGVDTAGKGLSRLRHTLRSVAGGAGDEAAADILAGHQLPGMRKVYETVDDDRLRRVSDHVRTWLLTPSVG